MTLMRVLFQESSTYNDIYFYLVVVVFFFFNHTYHMSFKYHNLYIYICIKK